MMKRTKTNDAESLKAQLDALRAWLLVRSTDHTYGDGATFVALTLEEMDRLAKVSQG